MIYTIFDLTDSSGAQLYTKLHISPQQFGFSYSGSIVSADTICVRELREAAGVPLVPNNYRVSLYGRNCATTFDISLPTASDNTTQSAVNFIVDYASNEYPNSASYAISSMTAANGNFCANYGGQAPNFTPASGSMAIAVDTSTTPPQMWFYYLNTWNN